MPSIYVVTGAARGIGHEFVKQLLAVGHTVVATIRNSSSSLDSLVASSDGKLIVLICDLASAESVLSFGQQLAKKVSHIDVLINNAGIAKSSDEENIANLQSHIITEQINTNVIGTHLVTQAAAPLFGSGTKIVNISSMVASFAITHSFPIGSVPSYSISKAALNMLTVKQAFFYTDCVIIALDPGRVQTDMNPDGLVSAKEAVASMIQVVNVLPKKDAGTFVSWEGKKVEW